MQAATVRSKTDFPASLHAVDEAGAAPMQILLAEDDARTRDFLRTILHYLTKADIVEASSAQEALHVAHALGRPIDLLISDVGLAGPATGIDLARQMNVPRVLLMSGRDARPPDIPSAWLYLAKPFPTRDLIASLACLGVSLSAQACPRCAG